MSGPAIPGEWGRAHAAAHDFDDAETAAIVAERYRNAPRWQGYDIKVSQHSTPPRYYVAAALRAEAGQ